MQSSNQGNRRSHDGNTSSFFHKKNKIPLEKNIQIALDNTRVLIYQVEHVSEVYKESEIVLENLAHILKVLEKLENQLNFIQSVLNTTSCEEVETLKMESEVLAKSYGGLKKKEDFSRVPLEDGIIFLINNVLPEADKSLSKSFQILADGHVNVIKPEDKIFEMQLIITKLLTAHTFLPRLAMFDKKDLISIERTAFVWRELKEFSTFRDYVTKDKIEESMRNSFIKFDKGLAVISSEGQENENDKIKNMFFRFQNVVWYSFKNFQTQAKLTLCLNDIKVEDAIAVWNLKERPLYKRIMKVRLPSIGFDNKIYVDRYFPRITKDLILEEYEEQTLCDEELLYIDTPDISQEKESMLEQINRNGEGKVQIRILYSESLDLKTSTIQDIKKFIKKHLNFSDNKLANSIDHIPGIIIHIHGGGFVSSSSSTHREYLNRWTNTLNKVIFSIDYRLAPQNPYPSALDDIWQAYLWILHFSEKILGIPSEKIILVGDCSGGNLALSLCLRLIKANLKLPHGCLLIYPILNLDSNKFSPSYFFSIGDPLLPYNLLKPCMEAYTTKDFNPKIDPYLSPIIAPDEFLAKLPPIRILTGSKDPVYDDSWRLVDRLRKVGQNVHLTIQEDMFHGFLRSEDLANYEMLVADGSKLIQELFLIGDQGVH